MDTSGKRQYNAPQIIVHGSIKQITKSAPTNKAKPGATDEFGDPISGQIA